MKNTTIKADLSFSDQGSIALITPLTRAGKKWLRESLATESWQWLGNNLGVDARYGVEIYELAADSGLNVKGGQ